MTAQIRGTIIKTPDSSPGLLVVEGQQKTFTLEGAWKSPVAPMVNMAVDIELDGAGFITGLTAVDSQQAAREKLKQIGGAAQERNDVLRGDADHSSRGFAGPDSQLYCNQTGCHPAAGRNSSAKLPGDDRAKLRRRHHRVFPIRCRWRRKRVPVQRSRGSQV